jgi:hypothetical protein
MWTSWPVRYVAQQIWSTHSWYTVCTGNVGWEILLQATGTIKPLNSTATKQNECPTVHHNTTCCRYAAQHSTALHSTAQHSTAQHKTHKLITFWFLVSLNLQQFLHCLYSHAAFCQQPTVHCNRTVSNHLKLWDLTNLQLCYTEWQQNYEFKVYALIHFNQCAYILHRKCLCLPLKELFTRQNMQSGIYEQST